MDVVILATTPHFRPAHLKACVDAGKHVFCEKPVAVDSPGVRAVLAACEEAKGKGLSIVSGLCWRYHDAVRETIQRVLDGAIGELVTIQETYNCGPPWFRNKVREPQWTEMEYQLLSLVTFVPGDHHLPITEGGHLYELFEAYEFGPDRQPGQPAGPGRLLLAIQQYGTTVHYRYTFEKTYRVTILIPRKLIGR